MKLTESTKQNIISEFTKFQEYMYSGKTKKERQELDQFFTPPSFAIKMLEQANIENLSGKVILDPTSGSGNLLAAALIAGADSDKVYGNEYDPVMVRACRERLNNVCDMLGKPRIKNWQIHRGDATDSFCLKYFGPDYKQKLKQHYLDSQPGIMQMLNMLTKEQEEFLKEVN